MRFGNQIKKSLVRLGLPLVAFSVWLAAAPLLHASRILTDELGRKVTVPDHPHRLICLIPNVADSVFALGAGADVIAVSDYTHYPPEARSKPSIGGPADPSLETIVAMHPDLAIGNGEFARPVADHLEKLGVPTYLLAPHGVDGIYQSLLDLGQVLDRKQRAGELVARLRSRVRAVQARVNKEPPVPVFVLIWSDPITTVGRPAFIGEWVELAGGHSITSDVAEEWPQISLEALVARAPQAFVIIRGSGVSLDDLEKRAEWRSIPAVRDHHVYYADERLQLPSPSAFDALEELAWQFHPDVPAPSRLQKPRASSAPGH